MSSLCKSVSIGYPIMRNDKSDNRGGRRRQADNTDTTNRIREALGDRDMTWLSRATGISTSSLSDYNRGRLPRVDAAVKIAAALKRDVAWLFPAGSADSASNASFDIDVVDLPKRAAKPDESAVPEGVVMIQELDLAYGLGATFVDAVAVSETARLFPVDWVRRYTASPPSRLRFAPGKGNSMSPTIDDGDIMLIDLAQTSPSFADLIWVCAIGEMGMVKRLATRADGAIIIKSDNRNVRDDVAYDGEIHIVGRVVAVIKKT